MQPFKTLLLALGAFLLAGQVVLAADQQRQEAAHLAGGGASALTLSIENGFGGILAIRYLAVLPEQNGRVTYVLFTDLKQFVPFANKVYEAEGSVVADLDGTGLRVLLKVTTGGSRLYGHVIQTSDRVIVLPSTARNLRNFRMDR